MGVPSRCPRTGGLGQGQHLFLRRFLQSKKRNSAAEKRGRAKIPSPNPLPFCPPERKLSKISVRIFFEKSSDFGQERQHCTKLVVSRAVLRLVPFAGLGGWGKFPSPFPSPCDEKFIITVTYFDCNILKDLGRNFRGQQYRKKGFANQNF